MRVRKFQRDESTESNLQVKVTATFTALKSPNPGEKSANNRYLREESKLCNPKVPLLCSLRHIELAGAHFDALSSRTFVFHPKISIKTFNKQLHQFYLSLWHDALSSRWTKTGPKAPSSFGDVQVRSTVYTVYTIHSNSVDHFCFPLILPMPNCIWWFLSKLIKKFRRFSAA